MIRDIKGVCESQQLPKDSINILMAFDKLQGPGNSCAAFSLHGCFELSTAQEYLKTHSSVGQYIIDHKASKEADIDIIENDIIRGLLTRTLAGATAEGVIVGYLPLRSVTTTYSVTALRNRLKDEDGSVINKKLQTATSMAGDSISKKEDGTEENTRLKHKLDRLSDNVDTFMDGKSVEELFRAIKSHTLEGMETRIAELSVAKSTKKTKAREIIDLRKSGQSLNDNDIERS
jgi:hypothetical protein